MSITPTFVEWKEDRPFEEQDKERRASVRWMRSQKAWFWSTGFATKNGPCGWAKSFVAAERKCLKFMSEDR